MRYSVATASATMARMETILAVETSGPLCSLALYAGGRWFEDTHNVERMHNQVVLTLLDGLVADAGIDRRALDAVAFGAGPGSFTGVRLAASVAQGVAFGAGAVVCPVSSSRAMALAWQRARHPGNDVSVVTVTRSRRDAYYVAGWRVAADGMPARLLDDWLHQGETLPEALPADLPGAGDRAPWWPDGRVFDDGIDVTGRIVGELGLADFRAGEGVKPAEAFPVYVQGDSPWRPAAMP